MPGTFVHSKFSSTLFVMRILLSFVSVDITSGKSSKKIRCFLLYTFYQTWSLVFPHHQTETWSHSETESCSYREGISCAADVVAYLSLDCLEVPSIRGENLFTLNLTTRLSWLGYIREVIQWLMGRIAASVRVQVRLYYMIEAVNSSINSFIQQRRTVT